MFILVLIGEKEIGKLICLEKMEFMILQVLTTPAINTLISNQVKSSEN